MDSTSGTSQRSKEVFSDAERRYRKNIYEKERRLSLVYIKSAIDRWNKLKDEHEWTHEQLALELLQHYETCPTTKQHKLKLESTPKKSHHERLPGSSLAKTLWTPRKKTLDACSLSSIEAEAGSVNGSEVDSERTLTAPFASLTADTIASSGIARELTVTSSWEYQARADKDDPDWDICEESSSSEEEPESEESFDNLQNFSIAFVTQDADHLPLEEAADDIFCVSDAEPAEEEVTLTGAKVNSSILVDSFNPSSQPTAVICYEATLHKLLTLKVPDECVQRGCNKRSTIQVSSRTVGTAIVLEWKCQNRHISASWCSQPLLTSATRRGQRTPVGDILLASSLFCSGNNFEKVSLMFRFAGFSCISRAKFYRLQKHVIIPEVEKEWLATERDNRQAMNGPLVVMGDGRMDSPGFSAKYCTYTIMDYHTKKILHMDISDKRETKLKSPNMEVLGAQRSLSTLVTDNLEVVEFVTDAHPQVTSMMKKSFPAVRHSYDIWHGTKNLGKKLAAESTTKGKADLKKWIGDISNHMWQSAKTCGRNTNVFRSKLMGCLHHVTDRHVWALGRCEHAPLDEGTRDKPWLEPDSPSHQALRHVLYAPYFLRTLPYYVTCRTTADLEGLNNHILMYASKRYAYEFPSYRARCYLAAIDYSKHLGRPYKYNKQGELVEHRQWSKAAGHWKAVPVKEPKQYEYIPALLERITRATATTVIRAKRELNKSDPRNIASHIAPIDPPSTKQLAEDRKKFERMK